MLASGMHSGVSAVSKELFTAIATFVPNIKHGHNEIVVRLLDRSCRVDCALREKKKIIEFYGDYWHGNPVKYSSSSNIANGKIAQDKWNIDAARVASLIQAGYEVLIIWEAEFKENPQKTIEKCVAFLNS